MSLLSKYVFDPIAAAISRATTSSNKAVSSSATQLSTTYAKVAADVAAAAPAAALATNSAAGSASTIIGDLENGLMQTMDAFLTATMAAAGPIGIALAPEAVQMANVGLTFAEQHALTYVSSLFSHAKAQITAAPKPE